MKIPRYYISNKEYTVVQLSNKLDLATWKVAAKKMINHRKIYESNELAIGDTVWAMRLEGGHNITEFFQATITRVFPVLDTNLETSCD